MIGYAPIFFYQPHVAPSGWIYAKGVAQMIADRIDEEGGMEIFMEGKSDPVAILLEAKLDEKGSALVGKIRLGDYTLRETFNPVDMWFTVGLKVVHKPGLKVIGKDCIEKIGPAFCGVHGADEDSESRETSNGSDS